MQVCAIIKWHRIIILIFVLHISSAPIVFYCREASNPGLSIEPNKPSSNYHPRRRHWWNCAANVALWCVGHSCMQSLFRPKYANVWSNFPSTIPIMVNSGGAYLFRRFEYRVQNSHQPVCIAPLSNHPPKMVCASASRCPTGTYPAWTYLCLQPREFQSFRYPGTCVKPSAGKGGEARTIERLDKWNVKSHSINSESDETIVKVDWSGNDNFKL